MFKNILHQQMGVQTSELSPLNMTAFDNAVATL